MYNLFVSGRPGRWDVGVCEYQYQRAINFGAFTEVSLTNHFGSFDPRVLEELKKFPCLFIYEPGCGDKVEIGWITNIKARPADVRVSFRLVKLSQEIPYAKLMELKMQLDMTKGDQNTTHWSLKEVDLLTVLQKAGLIGVDDINRIKGDVVVNASEETLKKIDNGYVKEFHDKSLDRLEKDPEGSITAARSLLETVCKHILSKKSVAFYEGEKLPALYKKITECLKFVQANKANESFKKVLSGSSDIVEGFSDLRNIMSDSHGKGPDVVKTEKRHARLAVNLAAAVSFFLLETYESEAPSSNALDKK